jgi:hypothetical protein
MLSEIIETATICFTITLLGLALGFGLLKISK